MHWDDRSLIRSLLFVKNRVFSYQFQRRNHLLALTHRNLNKLAKIIHQLQHLTQVLMHLAVALSFRNQFNLHQNLPIHSLQTFLNLLLELPLISNLLNQPYQVNLIQTLPFLFRKQIDYDLIGKRWTSYHFPQSSVVILITAAHQLANQQLHVRTTQWLKH